MRLDPDIDSAAISERRTNPKAGSNTSAAMGIAIELEPIAQPRFQRILRSLPRPMRVATATSSLLHALSDRGASFGPTPRARSWRVIYSVSLALARSRARAKWPRG
jgi:hypothetical protein